MLDIRQAAALQLCSGRTSQRLPWRRALWRELRQSQRVLALAPGSGARPALQWRRAGACTGAGAGCWRRAPGSPSLCSSLYPSSCTTSTAVYMHGHILYWAAEAHGASNLKVARGISQWRQGAEQSRNVWRTGRLRRQERGTEVWARPLAKAGPGSPGRCRWSKRARQ